MERHLSRAEFADSRRRERLTTEATWRGADVIHTAGLHGLLPEDPRTQ